MNQYIFVKRASVFFATAIVFISAAPRLRADDTPGKLMSLVNGGTLARDLFSYSPDGKTLTVTGDFAQVSKWFITGNPTASLNGQLIGIQRFYIVDVSGTPNPKPGPAATGTAGQGYVAKATAADPHVNWVLLNENGYVGWDTPSQNGFPTNANAIWLTAAPDAGAAEHEFGSFKFTSSILGFDIGLDYMVKHTDGSFATGRGYFSPVPEPVFYQLGALLGLGWIGLLRMRGQAVRKA